MSTVDPEMSTIDEEPLPPPVRRILVDREPTVVQPPVATDAVLRRGLAPAGPERMRLEALSVFYGEKQAVKTVDLIARRSRAAEETRLGT